MIKSSNLDNDLAVDNNDRNMSLILTWALRDMTPSLILPPLRDRLEVEPIELSDSWLLVLWLVISPAFCSSDVRRAGITDVERLVTLWSGANRPCIGAHLKYLKQATSLMINQRYSSLLRPPRTPFGHIWALIWSGVRGNIARTAL